MVFGQLFRRMKVAPDRAKQRSSAVQQDGLIAEDMDPGLPKTEPQNMATREWLTVVVLCAVVSIICSIDR
jgi:hypothetical protein